MGGSGDLEGREWCDIREAERDEGNDESEALWLLAPVVDAPEALAYADDGWLLVVVRVAVWAEAIPRSVHLTSTL